MTLIVDSQGPGEVLLVSNVQKSDGKCYIDVSCSGVESKGIPLEGSFGVTPLQARAVAERVSPHWLRCHVGVRYAGQPLHGGFEWRGGSRPAVRAERG